MSEQERREPAVGATTGETDEAITLGQEVTGPTVGERIRKGREAAGLSAADLAQPLNLDLKVIELIERDQLDAVPGRPYILAYLRTWAGQLDLDGDELIAQYNAQRAPDNGGVQGGIHPTLDVMEPKGGGLGRRLLGWVGILVVIAIVVLALSRLDADRVQAWWADLSGANNESSADTESSSAEDPDASDSRPAIEGALDEPPAPPTAEQAAAGQDEGSTAALALPGERLAAIDTATRSEPAASADPNDEASQADAAAPSAADVAPDAEAAAAETSEAAPAPAESRPPALVLRATRADSWVEVRDGNGERLMYDVLAAGEERAFAEATGPFSLVLGQPEGLEVEYQGEPVELGEPSGATGVLRTTVGNS
ncbi:DUF4115 domain-containing protein [Guyparkeria halophila]|uniref:DUF4115 domain-containing protein n=1 Tax=Guyparkeria halophila TaxID=47960 RepID=A0A6I6CW19_9GAMM|nr:helix-turn-helix domain-containing protein [Guyparkeria halophila]QGT77470.1 DUF4115 domain-containing protein [Guyparkeria halophila]